MPRAEPPGPEPAHHRDPSDHADGFGRKLAWLALRTTDRDAVVAALGLADVRAAAWGEAVDAAYEGDVLVTPPLSGAQGAWVLVAGDDLDDGPDRLAGLSRRLGTEAQLFATHRVSAYAAWARAVDGRLVRAFERADGELVRWVGAPDEVEQAVGLAALVGLADRAQVTAWDVAAGDDAHPWLAMDEDEVGQVAQAWSLSPFDRALSPADGVPLVGVLDDWEV